MTTTTEKEFVNNFKLKEYALLKDEIKRLTGLTDELSKEILADMQTQRVQKISSPYGTYFTIARKTWIYPEDIKKKEEAVKQQKKKLEESGKLEYKESVSLSFRTTDLVNYLE